PLSSDEDDNTLFLDQAHDEILPLSYVMVQTPAAFTGDFVTREVFQVTDAQSVQRNAYGISGKTTRLSLSAPWWTGKDSNISQTLRTTLVFGQIEEVILVEEH